MPGWLLISPFRRSEDTTLLTQRSLLSRESESFGTPFRQAESTGGSFFRVLQMEREPETSGDLRVYQEYREKLGAKGKRREGHSRRFLLTWLSAEVR